MIHLLAGWLIFLNQVKVIPDISFLEDGATPIHAIAERGVHPGTGAGFDVSNTNVKGGLRCGQGY